MLKIYIVYDNIFGQKPYGHDSIPPYFKKEVDISEAEECFEEIEKFFGSK